VAAPRLAGHQRGGFFAARLRIEKMALDPQFEKRVNDWLTKQCKSISCSLCSNNQFRPDDMIFPMSQPNFAGGNPAPVRFTGPTALQGTLQMIPLICTKCGGVLLIHASAIP
jgi:hypothetical protein